MKNGTWLAMFPRERTPTLDDLVAALAKRKGLEPRIDGDTVVVTVHDELTRRTVEIAVGLSALPSVLEESREIARDFGAGRPDRDIIARSDARFEIVWPLVQSDEALNPLLAIAETLAKLAGAVTFDTTSGEFV